MVVKRTFENLITFLKETRAELKKVVWPDKRYVAVATVIILFLVTLTGLYVMGIDFVFGKMFKLLLKY